MQRTNGGANGSEVVTPTSTMRRRSPNSPLVLGFVVGFALCLGIGAYVLTSPYSGIVNGATSKIKTNEELARIAKNFVTALYGCDFSNMSSEEILEYGPVAERCLPYIKPGPESYNNFVSMVSETFKTSKPGTVRVIKGTPTVVATDERTYRVVVPYEIVEVKDKTEDAAKDVTKDEGEKSSVEKEGTKKETYELGEVSQGEPSELAAPTDGTGDESEDPVAADTDGTEELPKKDTSQTDDDANDDKSDEDSAPNEDNTIKEEKAEPDKTSEGHGETENDAEKEDAESTKKPKTGSATNEAVEYEAVEDSATNEDVEDEAAEDSATDEDVEDEVAEDTWAVSVDENNNVAAAKVGANGGDYTTGDETTGDYTTGDETTGDYTTGDDTTGGDETSGGETTGDYTTGDETASGDYTPSDDTSRYEVAPSYDVTTSYEVAPSYDEGSTETYGDASGGAGDSGVASGESGDGAEV